MIIGVPKEIKANEHRVSVIPGGVQSMVRAGHQVFVETQAGVGSGFSDQDYVQAGAQILSSPKEVFDKADMIVKVKEPQPQEYEYFKKDLILFTYLHLAPEPELTKALMQKEVVSIAYETIELPDRSLPLLTPMSEVAGRMAVQVGAQILEKHRGGKGVLLGGVPGVAAGHTVIIGGGVVGTHSAKMALGLGARVTILDNNPARLRYLDDIFGGRIQTMMSNEHNIAECVKEADLLVGAVLIPGAKAPHLVTDEMVKTMEPGSAIVDVAIDQGGSIATIDRITTHENPTYEKYGVIHYSVANMPGAVARTSTFALTNVTLPYALRIAEQGYETAIKMDPGLAKGVNVYKGHVTYAAVSTSLNLPYKPLEELL